MEARKPSKFSVLGANALLGLLFAALSALADDVPRTPNAPAGAVPAKVDHGATQPPKFEDRGRNTDVCKRWKRGRFNGDFPT